jgi:DNA-binding response OmpR family regulator
MGMARILVLSAGRGGVGAAAAALATHGYEVQVVLANGTGVRQVTAFWPDLVLVHFDDRMEPGLVADVRSRSTVPLVVWADRGDQVDAVQTLRQGADDYLGGEVEGEEVEARVVAQLRRARWSGGEG